MRTHHRKVKEGKVDRGNRIDPLPSHMHAEFERFCDQMTSYARSHYGTWLMATRLDTSGFSDANAVYWRSVIRWMSTLEYFGVGINAASSVSRNTRARTVNRTGHVKRSTRSD